MDESPVTQKQLRDAISESEIRLLDRIEKTETTLLTEFRKWALPIQSRVKLIETYQAGFTTSVNERLTFIEERLSTLEQK